MIKLNFRKILSSITILTVGAPSTLMVVACGKQEEVDIEKKIVDAINHGNYNKQVNATNKAELLKEKINVDLIKSKLDAELIKKFDDNKFHLNSFLNKEDKEILDEELMNSGTIEAKINYDYGKFENQEINLTIEVKAKVFFELKDGKVNALLHSANGKLYAGTEKGNIWEVNLTEKKFTKLLSIPEKINSLFEVSNGKLYAGTSKNHIWEIDLEKNTSNLAFHNLGSGSDGSDVVSMIQASNNKLYIGTGIGNVFEFDLENPEAEIVKYRLDDFGIVTSLFEGANNKIYVSTTQGNIWEIDLENTQQIRIDEPLLRLGKNIPIYDMKQINAEEFLFTIKDKIYQFDLKTNEPTEKFHLEDKKDEFLLLKNTEKGFYVTTKSGKLYELDLKNNKMTSNINLEDGLVCSLLVTNDYIYVGTDTGIRELVLI